MPASLRNPLFPTLVLLAAVLARDAHAQLISLRTVPIPMGEQFVLFPSMSRGMGGLSIAVDDPLADPFANPAKGARIERIELFAAPVFYGANDDLAGGRTLPVSMLLKLEPEHFAALGVAVQQLDVQPLPAFVPLSASERGFLDESTSNRYLAGTFGRKLGGGRSAIGFGVFHAELNAIDALAQLYANSTSIAPTGSMTDYRIGFLHDFARDRSLEAVLVNNRVDMKHEVLYVATRWDAAQRRDVTDSRIETNFDQTSTWGAHARYTTPIDDDGGRVGLVFTANRKGHPKIPDYDVVAIPRDPGNSRAFNLGVGFSRQRGDALFGIEAVYEPAWSHTWAYADTALNRAGGGRIEPGGRTADNRFRFGNIIFAVGFQQESESAAYQLGLRLRFIHFTLRQKDFVQDVERRSNESWAEWIPTWSYLKKFSGFELRYSGRMSSKGFPSVFDGWGGDEEIISDSGGSDVVIPVTGASWMRDYRILTHQLAVSVPFGK